MSDSTIIDWTMFRRTRSELGAGFVKIVGYFLEDGEKAVSKIEDAMRRRDTAAVVLPSHTLKTEARQFGAEALGALAEEIEFAGRRAIEMRLFPDDLIPAAAKLRPIYEETMGLLQKEINPLVSRRPAFGRAGANNQNFGRL